MVGEQHGFRPVGQFLLGIETAAGRGSDGERVQEVGRNARAADLGWIRPAQNHRADEAGGGELFKRLVVAPPCHVIR